MANNSASVEVILISLKFKQMYDINIETITNKILTGYDTRAEQCFRGSV